MAEGFREGWAPILSSLKTFLESGKPLVDEKGQPVKPDATPAEPPLKE